MLLRPLTLSLALIALVPASAARAQAPLAAEVRAASSDHDTVDPAAQPRLRGVLFERRAGSWLELPEESFGFRLAYNRQYRLEQEKKGQEGKPDNGGPDNGGPDKVVDFRTSALPADFVTSSWQFVPGSSLARQKHISAAFAGTPALARMIAGQVDGATHVSFTGCYGGKFSCGGFQQHRGGYFLTIAPSHLTNTKYKRFIILHEFGHVLSSVAIDTAGQTAFENLFHGSPAWKNCFRAATVKGCLPTEEIFAEQFAFWASGSRQLRSGYKLPPLASKAAFGRVLTQQYGFRPLFNPLAP